MTLSDADLERARRAAASAPVLTEAQKAQLRAIFAGCSQAAPPARPDAPAQPGEAA